MATTKCKDCGNEHVCHVPDDHAQALKLLAELADPDPCWFDHHGGCQAHGCFDFQPGPCPHQAAKDLLARSGQSGR